ncbi:hypothetical protein [Moorena sp. SIO4G3]|uniref:hypothetical protein n=1 Tax=Moorena sp. SIO4G3 TaxID=2607821 RepID=UPI001428ED48|nr:hypothetical protein [Moorena sp. SIO4G3]NEO80056.1 hypothetical protein [Moorena sp. SIO4G3]
MGKAHLPFPASDDSRFPIPDSRFPIPDSLYIDIARWLEFLIYSHNIHKMMI